MRLWRWAPEINIESRFMKVTQRFNIRAHAKTLLRERNEPQLSLGWGILRKG
ncbi:hypothetical protein BRCON_0684 [Candidatus Sumerlaea chitinivorans]|uniref:Uncharacterized protein n=1 Tax=Sumerlaea chitinivorans TaxID=2250252 RepID=A0A2Z4Y2R6_SUMC1|nr:hypothetical protein BRCON_0684 [Candidatus Sumerlaea chitinivorans]